MGDMDYVRNTGAVMLAAALVTGVVSILGTYFSAEVATTFARNTRQRLFDHTQELSYQDFKRFSTSSLITRATNDIEQLQSTLSMFFEMIIPAPFIIVIGMILAFNRDPLMALIILVVAIVLLATFGVAAKKSFRYLKRFKRGLTISILLSVSIFRA